MDKNISSSQCSNSDFDDNEYEYLIFRLRKIKEIISLLEDNL